MIHKRRLIVKEDDMEERNLNEPETESSPKCSEYELSRASNTIKKNLSMLSSLGLVSPM